jgi:ketosteroid isomerase-like protein
MKQPDPESVALRFNDRINDRDLEGLVQLMTDGHTFIDKVGDVTSGREEMKRCWARFFESFPDYRNNSSRVENRGNVVIMIWHSKCRAVK